MDVFKKSLVIFILLFMGSRAENSEANPIVQIRSGKIRGTVLKSYEGKDYHAFMSIPYGKSTSGLLRFKPPKRVDPWGGIFDATSSDSVECSQLDFLTKKATGTEDCLIINVYVPQREPHTALPVLVFIHGGGFSFGSGAHKFYGPQKFMDHNVILVTFNYRLGIFGFLNTQDSVSPGNYGMLDQVLALHWVNENIANFGGDPELITIFGESAGAASVVYHMISPLSKGLFSNAIAQSGSALNPWGFQKKPLEWAQKVAESVHCPTADTSGMLDCFQRSSSETLIEGSGRLLQVGLFPLLAAPSVEGPGGEGFLTDDPVALMKGRKIHKVPFFAGILQDEGYPVYTMFSKKFNNEAQKFLDEDLASYLSFILNVDPEINNHISAVKKEYFADVNLNNSNAFKDRLIKMVGDCLSGAGVSKTLDLFVKADIPTLGYVYTHRLANNIASFYGGSSSGEYIGHGDEMLLQFQISDPEMSPMNANDTKLSNMINSLWANIAAGNVLVINTGKKAVEWELYDKTDHNYLNLNLQPQMEKGKLCTKDDFWLDTVAQLLVANGTNEYEVKGEL